MQDICVILMGKYQNRNILTSNNQLIQKNTCKSLYYKQNNKYEKKLHIDGLSQDFHKKLNLSFYNKAKPLFYINYSNVFTLKNIKSLLDHLCLF